MLEHHVAQRPSIPPSEDNDEAALRTLLRQRRTESSVDGPAALAEIRSRLSPARG